MRRGLLIALTFIALLPCLASYALADQEGGGFAYKAFTADRKHVFVMLNRNDPSEPSFKDDLYPSSGMYLNDGSNVALWSVDWGAGVYLPNGGEYVVRRGAWARYSGSYEEEAFTFFYRNELLETFRVKNLVDFPWLLSHTASHYTWSTSSCSAPGVGDGSVVRVGGSEYPNNSGVRFDDQNRTMEVETQLGDRLVFDFTTGTMIAASRPARTICIAAFFLLLIAYLFYRYVAVGGEGFSISASNLVIGFLIITALVSIPTTVTSFTGAHDTCDSEFAPTLYKRIWLAYYLIPPYVMSFIVGSEVGQQIMIVVGSWGTILRTALFWSGAIFVFALLDRAVMLAFFFLNSTRTKA